MWSYVQRRNIARRVRREVKETRAAIRRPKEKTLSPFECHGPQGDDHGVQAPYGEQAAMNSHDKEVTVGAAGEEDPLDPRNWSLASRAKNITILCFLIFAQGWAGSADSMGNTAASQEFHVTSLDESLSTAMYLFGVGTGALFAGPLSETSGRNAAYLVSTFFYLCFVLGSALSPTFGGQIVCRFLVGLFSSATLATNGSSVSDQFRPVKRGFVFPLMAWANVAAPCISPVVGGWVVSSRSLSWRWTEWITLIISGSAFLIALLFLPETYFPILLDWKAKELRHVTGDKRYTSEHKRSASLLGRLRRNLLLPVTFFRTEPVIIALGLYLVLLYIILFTFLKGFDYIFKQTYGLSVGLTGSCFASIAAGSTCFTFLSPVLYIWARKTTHHIRGAAVDPEFRLWPAVIAGPLLPASLFWLGWTNYSSISIWSGLTACFVFGIVVTATYVSSYEYIIDSYGDHSATALASITMARYLLSGGMVVAARPMYEALGVHWTLTLLGCIAVVLAPAPIVFWFYGEKLREKSPYTVSPEQTKTQLA